AGGRVVEGGGGGGDLLGDVHAVALVLHHARDAPHLALDALEAASEVVLAGHVPAAAGARLAHGRMIHPGSMSSVSRGARAAARCAGDRAWWAVPGWGRPGPE